MSEQKNNSPDHRPERLQHLADEELTSLFEKFPLSVNLRWEMIRRNLSKGEMSKEEIADQSIYMNDRLSYFRSVEQISQNSQNGKGEAKKIEESAPLDSPEEPSADLPTSSQSEEENTDSNPPLRREEKQENKGEDFEGIQQKTTARKEPWETRVEAGGSDFIGWLKSLDNSQRAETAEKDDAGEEPGITQAPEKEEIEPAKDEKKIKVRKKKKKKKKKTKSKGKSPKELELQPDIATETLANLLASQGHREEANEMYRLLSLKYPEKSSYFAAKIKKT